MIEAHYANPEHTTVIVTKGLPRAPMVGEVKEGDPVWMAIQVAGISPAPYTPPPPTPADVDAERDRRLAEGFADSITGKTYQCRARDVAIWTAIAASASLNVLRGEPYSATTYDLITADNTTITLSAAEASALFEQRVMPWVSAVYLHARTLKDQIIAGQQPDISQGWPAFTQD